MTAGFNGTFWQKSQKVFFVLSILGLGAIAWARSTGRAPLPQARLEVCYALPARQSAEDLVCRPFSPTGEPQGRPTHLGRLGLVAQTGVATADGNGFLVTVGGAVDAVQGGRIRTIARAPHGWTVLEVKNIAGQVWALLERAGAHRARVAVWTRGHWRQRDILPHGIAEFLVGPQGIPAVAVMTPMSARVIFLSHRAASPPPLTGVAPQGSVAFVHDTALIPFATGVNGFGLAQGQGKAMREKVFRSVRRAVIMVTNTTPVWGISPSGMIPWRSGRFATDAVLPWPKPLPGTMTVIGRGTPWIVIVAGMSQGVWFNVAKGRFGPSFQIKTPWRAVVRAIALGS